MVEILLATYNGEKYLKQQLDSLLSQTFSEYRILIRDDGSTDATISILEEYKKIYSDKIILVNDSEKCGSATSNFMQLAKVATADYIMYCDQVDVWFPEKIERTMNKMRELEKRYGKEMPILVFATYQSVNSELKVIGDSERGSQIEKKNTDLNTLIVQNCVTGCLMMVNRALNEKMGDYHKDILMHDWWAALIASSMGIICHIPDILMFYRQHDNNVVGSVNVKSFKYRINKICDKNTKKMVYRYRDQMQLFYSRYNRYLNAEKEQIVSNFISIYSQKSKFVRIKKLISGKYLKSDFIRILGQIWYI